MQYQTLEVQDFQNGMKTLSFFRAFYKSDFNSDGKKHGVPKISRDFVLVSEVFCPFFFSSFCFGAVTAI